MKGSLPHPPIDLDKTESVYLINNPTKHNKTQGIDRKNPRHPDDDGYPLQ